MSVEIGNYLRQARESVGLSLDEVQEKTRIQKSFLDAIEKGDFDKLPSPFYVRTYLRSYANCVKVEPHYILREYRKKEQAERYQTGQFQVSQLTQQLNSIEQTGVHRFGLTGTLPKVSQDSRPSVANRTSLNTALTIANSGETNTRKLPTISRRVELEQISQTKFSTGSTKPERKFPSLLPSQALTTRTQSTTSREKQETTQESPVTNKQLTAEGRTVSSQTYPTRQQKQQTSPQKSVNQTSQFPPSRLTRSVESETESVSRKTSTQKQVQVETETQGISQEANKFSRTTRFRTTSSLPTVSTKTSRESVFSSEESNQEKRFSRESNTQRHSSVVEQKVVEVQPLRRSSLHNKPAKSNGFFTSRVIIAIIVAVLLLGGVVWYLSTENSKSNEVEQKSTVVEPKTEEKQLPASGSTNESSTSNEEDNKGSVTKDGPGVYTLTGTDQAEIIMKPKGTSWVQIRTQKAPTKDYLKDVTLTSKDSVFKYTYAFSDGPDLYISLGSPDNVAITINGIPIASTQIIHITKK